MSDTPVQSTVSRMWKLVATAWTDRVALATEFGIVAVSTNVLSFAFAGPFHPFSWRDWYIGWPMPIWYDEGGAAHLVFVSYWAVVVDCLCLLALASILRAVRCRCFRGKDAGT